jgi:hypothetical protein
MSNIVDLRAARPLTFTNFNAVPKVSTVFCDRTSVPHIMAWYAAYYAGDLYSVTFDGKNLAKDENGELVEE